MSLRIPSFFRLPALAIAAVACAALALPASAQIGKVKVVNGTVTIERAGASLPAKVGAALLPADVLRTGADGSVGVMMSDDSLLSAGANSVLRLDRYEYDATTSRGRFDSSLSKGSLSVVSGRIAKESPEAMTVRTPLAILGVRGTQFLVAADDGTASR